MITIEFLRQYRIFGYAIFDLGASLLGMYFLAPLLSKLFLNIRLKIPKLSWLYFTIPLGILIHLIVGNMTLMTRNFIDLQSNYILKIVVIALFLLGIRGIKVGKKSKHST